MNAEAAAALIDGAIQLVRSARRLIDGVVGVATARLVARIGRIAFVR